MLYKTTDKNHRGSIGVLGDLIKKHGTSSSEVESYLERFKNDESFIKRASLLVRAGQTTETVREIPSAEEKEEEKE